MRFSFTGGGLIILGDEKLLKKKKKKRQVNCLLSDFSTTDQSVAPESASKTVKQLHKYQFARLFNRLLIKKKNLVIIAYAKSAKTS